MSAFTHRKRVFAAVAAALTFGSLTLSLPAEARGGGGHGGFGGMHGGFGFRGHGLAHPGFRG